MNEAINFAPFAETFAPFALKSHLGVEPESNNDLNAKGAKVSAKDAK